MKIIKEIFKDLVELFKLVSYWILGVTVVLFLGTIIVAPFYLAEAFIGELFSMFLIFMPVILLVIDYCLIWDLNGFSIILLETWGEYQAIAFVLIMILNSFLACKFGLFVKKRVVEYWEDVKNR
jgi:hypothetical protein